MAFFGRYQKAVLPALFIIGWTLMGSVAANADSGWNESVHGVAIKGYDPVAYFTEGRAIKGNSEYFYIWNDARWHFATAEHRDLFAENPDRYAPKFKGYCAYGVSMGQLAAADPEQWTIVDGKLYMNYNRELRDRWRRDKTNLIPKAEENWEEISE